MEVRIWVLEVRIWVSKTRMWVLKARIKVFGANITELRPKFRFLNQIWPILPRFGPFCREIAHFAWIWAILLGFWPFCLDLGPKGDEPLRMGLGGTYVRTDRFPLCSTGLRPLRGRCPKRLIFQKDCKTDNGHVFNLSRLSKSRACDSITCYVRRSVCPSVGLSVDLSVSNT